MDSAIASQNDEVLCVILRPDRKIHILSGHYATIIIPSMPLCERGGSLFFKEELGRFSIYWPCLIYEHDRDILPDLIHQLAVVADKPVLGIIQMDISFAFRARENIKQFFADCHVYLLFNDCQAPL